MTRLILISIDGLASLYWTDPLARMPRLRELADEGVVAARMETIFPSTTWPAHVTLATGVSPARHGVVGNSLLNRATGAREDLTGDPIYDASELIRAPTIYERAHAAGLRTAAIDWPATRGCPALDFNLPFFKDQRVFEAHTPDEVWTELRERGYPTSRQGEWAELPKRFLKDAMVARLAADVFRRRAPDLLLTHFLCVDSFQHLYGPRSPEAYWALEYVDRLVGEVLDAVRSSAPGETAVCVVSDHGFLPVRREIRINVRLRDLGDGARFVMNHGAGYVYRLGAAGDDRQDAGWLREVGAELATVEGVGGVWTPRDYADLGLPLPAVNLWTGDLVLEAAPGYCFADDAEGDLVSDQPRYRGTHGQRPGHPDLGAVFLAAGGPFAAGARLPAIRSRDVAPTLGRVLGIGAGATEGRVLEEGLR